MSKNGNCASCKNAKVLSSGTPIMCVTNKDPVNCVSVLNNGYCGACVDKMIQAYDRPEYCVVIPD